MRMTRCATALGGTLLLCHCLLGFGQPYPVPAVHSATVKHAPLDHLDVTRTFDSTSAILQMLRVRDTALAPAVGRNTARLRSGIFPGLMGKPTPNCDCLGSRDCQPQILDTSASAACQLQCQVASVKCFRAIHIRESFRSDRRCSGVLPWASDPALLIR